jgi:hypothetical protein
LLSAQKEVVRTQRTTHRDRKKGKEDMGASTFTTISRGQSAREAFDAAREEARHAYGHGGYTGTIAEKRSFVVIQIAEGADPREHANALLDDDDRRIADKWGPAGCIALGGGEYLFFGWAST